MRSEFEERILRGRCRGGAGCWCLIPRDEASCLELGCRVVLPVLFETCDALEYGLARRGLLTALLFLSGEGDGICDVSSSKLSVKNSALGGVGCLPINREPTARD